MANMAFFDPFEVTTTLLYGYNKDAGYRQAYFIILKLATSCSVR
ncbi:hypothetical protein SAMN04488513_101930 [Pseudozobellia thermophila]|uniref:Uncharacterized protein n=1 Tax=Pseudozobellia thermophila TaxID=192903 RepID=A0A1M6CZ86_9FLAO|nr:hypothetical protein SAMN04488513_101930 [Pseudozobellia thermophila]